MITTAKKPPRQRPPKRKLATVSIRLTEELAERLRNAIWWTPGASMVSVGQAAVEREIERMEDANGGPFRRRERKELVKGPRPGS